MLQLGSVDAHDNPLSSEATFPRALLHCSALQWLDLSENDLSALPEELGQLAQLEYLGLSGNEIPSEDVERARALLPNCCIETNRIVYTMQEKTFNLIIAGKDLVITHDGALQMRAAPATAPYTCVPPRQQSAIAERRCCSKSIRTAIGRSSTRMATAAGAS